MSTMDVMDRVHGHNRHIWDSSNDAEVKAMRALFNSLTAEGYRAFNVKGDGEQGTRMDSFDPKAEKMIMVPQLRGG